MSEMPQTFNKETHDREPENIEYAESFDKSWNAVFGNKEIPHGVEQKARSEHEHLYDISRPLGKKGQRILAGMVMLTALAGALGGPSRAEAQSFPNAKKTTVEEQLKWEAQQKTKRVPGWQESGPIVVLVQKEGVPLQKEKLELTVNNFWRDVGLISGHLAVEGAPSENDKRMADQSLKEAASIILGKAPGTVTPEDKVFVFDRHLSGGTPQFKNQNEFKEFRNRGGVSALKIIIQSYREGLKSK